MDRRAAVLLDMLDALRRWMADRVDFDVLEDGDVFELRDPQDR